METNEGTVLRDKELKEKVKAWGGVFSTQRYVEDFTVTPEIAKEFIDTMKKNRKLKPKVVRRYANDIKEGKFNDCPGLICFDTNGCLIDGQHRMAAIISADKPVTISLKFGFAPTTIFDKNAVRTTSDTFTISSLTDPAFSNKNVISIINMALEMKFGASYVDTTSDSKKADFANKYGEELITASYIAEKGMSHGVCRRAGIEAGFFAALIYGVPEQTLFRFADCANNLRAESQSETAATIFASQVIKNNYSGRSARESLSKAAQEAISWFCSGQRRTKSFPGNDNKYFDAIDLTF